MKIQTQIKRDISRYKAQLVAKCIKTGLYENFGQKEVRKLEDKYLNISDYSTGMDAIRDLIMGFDDWASTYNGR